MRRIYEHLYLGKTVYTYYNERDENVNHVNKI